MKSKIHRGLTVKSELKPAVSIKDPSFIYTKGADLATKFRLIYEQQAAAKVENVTPMRRAAK